jgi:hypothetical protein
LNLPPIAAVRRAPADVDLATRRATSKPASLSESGEKPRARIPSSSPPISAPRASKPLHAVEARKPASHPDRRDAPSHAGSRDVPSHAGSRDAPSHAGPHADHRNEPLFVAAPPFASLRAPVEPVHAQACVTPVRRRGLPVWITLGVGSVALIAAGYMGALVQLETKGASTSVARPAPPPAAAPNTEASSAPARTPAPEPEAPPAPSIAPAPAPPPRAHARTKPVSTAHATRPGASAISSSSTPPAPALRPESQPPVLTIRPLSSTESPAAPLSAAAEPTTTGERPTRDEVMRGLAGLHSQLVECADGRHGLVNTRVTIAPSGRVTYSLIGGDFVGTPQGSCMARALRSATFPPFSGPSLKVLFPYSL